LTKGQMTDEAIERTDANELTMAPLVDVVSRCNENFHGGSKDLCRRICKYVTTVHMPPTNPKPKPEPKPRSFVNESGGG
jgi:hypothetical protein